MLLHELYDEQVYEGPMWDKIRKYGAGAAVAGGIAGAATMGLGNKSADKPVTPTSAPAAVSQQAEPDVIPANMFEPGDLNPSKPSASTAQMANKQMENQVRQAAQKQGMRGDELAAFLAQTAHETSSFTKLNELGNDAYFKGKYDIRGNNPELAKRLGNVRPGDGVLYHGRGLIHLTGRTNYRIAGEALGIPLEKNPKLAADPEVAARIAVWFWNTRVKPNVTDWDDVRSVTRKINSGMAGLDDRQNNYDYYRKKLANPAKIAQK